MSNDNKKSNKKGDEDMATNTMVETYTLNEEEAFIILNAPIKKVKATNVEKDYTLTKEERIIQARRILDSNR